jgi:hypothetical protein
MAGPAMIAYKFLRTGRIGPFSRVAWPAPAGGEPGAWVHAFRGGGTCDGRVHACRAADLTDWFGSELWRVELDGDVALDCGKLVADRGRLLARVEAWDAEAAAGFAGVCALRTRDSALAVLAAGDARTALADCATVAQLAAVRVPDLAPREARAAGYVRDAAGAALAARSDPSSAPEQAAVNAFIAAHAAAFAAGDVAAAPRERAALAAWLAQRLEL